MTFNFKGLRIAKGGHGNVAKVRLSPGQKDGVVDLRVTGGGWSLNSSINA